MDHKIIPPHPDLSRGEETIVALASGRGEAGVAVIRLSGATAFQVLDAIFQPARPGAVPAPSRLVYGSITAASGDPIDDCLAVRMPGPHSFTGEDVAEIQCHGSPAVVGRVIDRCIEAGARLAEPGEFSRRGFLNGKMDLAQAEALSDLIASRSEAARKLALRQLRGGLSQRLRQIYSDLIDAAAEIEAHIDFPEEDIPELARDAISAKMNAASDEMRRLLAGHEKARVKSDGARVILAGEPNAGKSSLFNAILGRDRAIVSPHPGTTRDTIEATVEMHGLAITLVDTAGIRTGADEVEQIGINRTFEEIQDADLVLHLVESNLPFEELASTSGVDPSRVIKIRTKSDVTVGEPGDADVHVSSATSAGLAALEAIIQKRLLGSGEDHEEVEMSRVRHAECLRHAVDSLRRAQEAFQLGESGDLVMVDLRDAIASIGEILGERLDEQILDRIFSTFCLGK